MKSPLWFVVAGLIALAGFVGAGFYLMPRLAVADAQMMRIVAPGSTVLILDKPGSYTIFHESKSTVDGQYYASDTVSGLQVALASEATGTAVKLAEPATDASYMIGSRSGTSVLAFTVDQPGRYRLTASLASGLSEPKVVLAISQGLFGTLLGVIFGTIAIALGGLGFAGAIVALVLWQRSKAVPKAAQSIEPGWSGG